VPAVTPDVHRLFPHHALDEHAFVGVLYREADGHGGATYIQTAHSNESGDPLTWQVDTSSTTSWTVTTGYEFRQGLTAEERCMDAIDYLTVQQSIRWLGTWTDERDTDVTVWGGTYEN